LVSLDFWPLRWVDFPVLFPFHCSDPLASLEFLPSFFFLILLPPSFLLSRVVSTPHTNDLMRPPSPSSSSLLPLRRDLLAPVSGAHRWTTFSRNDPLFSRSELQRDASPFVQVNVFVAKLKRTDTRLSHFLNPPERKTLFGICPSRAPSPSFYLGRLPQLPPFSLLLRGFSCPILNIPPTLSFST